MTVGGGGLVLSFCLFSPHKVALVPVTHSSECFHLIGVVFFLGDTKISHKCLAWIWSPTVVCFWGGGRGGVLHVALHSCLQLLFFCCCRCCFFSPHPVSLFQKNKSLKVRHLFWAAVSRCFPFVDILPTSQTLKKQKTDYTFRLNPHFRPQLEGIRACAVPAST